MRRRKFFLDCPAECGEKSNVTMMMSLVPGVLWEMTSLSPISAVVFL